MTSFGPIPISTLIFTCSRASRLKTCPIVDFTCDCVREIEKETSFEILLHDCSGIQPSLFDRSCRCS